MSKEEIIKKIDDICEMNREHRENVNTELRKVRNAVQGDLYEPIISERFDRKTWQLVEKVANLTDRELKTIFGLDQMSEVIKLFTPNKIDSKLYEYEEKQKSKEDLKRGDIVYAVRRMSGERFDDLIYLSSSKYSYILLDKNDERVILNISDTILLKKGAES